MFPNKWDLNCLSFLQVVTENGDIFAFDEQLG